MSSLRIAFVSLIVILTSSSKANADIVKDVVVSGNSGPWSLEGGINSASSYGTGDQTNPATLSQADGFSFVAGSIFKISYLSGTVADNDSYVYNGPNGDPNWISSQFGSSGARFPSYYMDSSNYPVGVAALLGVFTDAIGTIIGEPFKIGFGTSVVIPTGSSHLSFGVNDDIFHDNSGSFVVEVDQAIPLSVPEPSSLLMGATGIIAFLTYGYRLRSCRRGDSTR